MPETIRIAGRYEILREVGRGGMAVVYLARQTDLDRHVALKELAAFHASDAVFARRFVRESRLAASLSHTNIVTVHEYFEDGGIPYIAMEYVERGSLRPHVGSLGVAQVAGVLEGLLAGLAHAETRGVVHRDLKPENLMITDEGRVKITDFGIAKARGGLESGAMLTVTGMTVGTPTYMAPEQAMAKEIGPWTDLYSAGCIAFELLCGRPPFEPAEAPLATLMRHVNEPPVSPRSLVPALDPALSAWVERLLAKDPEQRPRGAASAWEELEEIVISSLGPRWRRDARLPDRGAVAETPRPLTPAPFESTNVRTPAPGSGDGFESFQLGAAATKGTAPEAATPETGTPEAAAPEAGTPDTATPQAGSPDKAAPKGAAPEAGTPDTATPQAGSPDTAAPKGTAPEAATPGEPSSTVPEPGAPSSGSSRFFTFRGSRFRPKPVEEPPVQEPPAPVEPVVPPPPEPVVAAPAPPEAAETVAPRTVPEPEPEAEPVRAAPHGRRIGVLAGIVVAFAVVGYLVAPRDEPEPTGPPALSATATSQTLELRHPPGLRRVDDVPLLAGIDVSDRIGLSGGGATIVAGRFQAGGPTLLPPELDGDAPEPQRVGIGRLTALRYLGLRPEGSDADLQLYAVPTNDGVATVACAGVLGVDCERIAATLRLRAGRASAPGPDPGHAKTIGEVFGQLRDARGQARNDLGAARRPASVAAPAAAIARAYGAAAERVGGLRTSAWDAAATRAIADALTRAGRAYDRLASAAGRGERRRYADARRDAAAAERAVTRAVAGLKPLGYQVGG